MNVVLVNLKYPYGKRQIYLNHSLVSVAARLGPKYKINFIDLNIDAYNNPYVQTALAQSDKVGISLLGAPYIPSAVDFCQRIQNDFPGKEMAIGGQVVEYISREAFSAIFANWSVGQIMTDDDFAKWGGENIQNIPTPLEVSCIPAYEQVGSERLRMYMEHEMTLEVSQGCIYKCRFCAARKGQREQMKNLAVFEEDLRFLAESAKGFGIKTLRFYASALDFFQNPGKKTGLLEILGIVRRETGVDIQTRCLTCMSSFLAAAEAIPDFTSLVKRAGIWCVGFGIDGADETVWARENKRHNKTLQVKRCIDLCAEMGVTAELLMVSGFPEDTLRVIWKTLKNSFRYARNANVILRPYVAKSFVPGNEGWTPEIEARMAAKPQSFYSIDYLALGSKLTHPDRWRRWIGNLAYVLIIALLSPLKRCNAVPILPQGEKGLYGKIARVINRAMPADR